MEREWKPLVSLGPVRFGEQVDTYIEALGLVRQDDDDATGWDGYLLPGPETYVYAEAGRVVSVGCWEECWYKGRNLIGLRQDEAWDVIGSPPEGPAEVCELDDGPQEVFEFPEVEAQVWVKDGELVTMYCSAH